MCVAKASRTRKKGRKQIKGSQVREFTFQGQQVLLFRGIHFHFDRHFWHNAYGGWRGSIRSGRKQKCAFGKRGCRTPSQQLLPSGGVRFSSYHVPYGPNSFSFAKAKLIHKIWLQETIRWDQYTTSEILPLPSKWWRYGTLEFVVYAKPHCVQGDVVPHSPHPFCSWAEKFVVGGVSTPNLCFIPSFFLTLFLTSVGD